MSWLEKRSKDCNEVRLERLGGMGPMRLLEVKMDTVTVSSMLPICAQSNDVVGGVLVHLYVIKHGLESDVFVSNALINMYSKFGRLQDAQRVFDGMEVSDIWDMASGNRLPRVGNRLQGLKMKTGG